MDPEQNRSLCYSRQRKGENPRSFSGSEYPVLATLQVVPRLGSRGAPWHGSKTPETGKKKTPIPWG